MYAMCTTLCEMYAMCTTLREMYAMCTTLREMYAMCTMYSTFAICAIMCANMYAMSAMWSQPRNSHFKAF